MVIDRPPACKIAEVRTGNYSLIWSGLIANLVYQCTTALLTSEQKEFIGQEIVKVFSKVDMKVILCAKSMLGMEYGFSQ